MEQSMQIIGIKWHMYIYENPSREQSVARQMNISVIEHSQNKKTNIFFQIRENEACSVIS